MHSKYLDVFVFFAVVIIIEVFCEQWKPYYKTSLMDFMTIRRTPDISIITNTMTSLSLILCATSCLQYQSRSLYYSEGSGICHCNSDLDDGPEDQAVDEIKYGQMGAVVEESHYESFVHKYVSPLKNDCLELYEGGHVTDGVYSILPVSGTSVDTWCDMTNGGWTVFQRRQDWSEDFYRGWSDYVTGFGNRTAEFWLGLDNIHLLTSEPSELHIFLDTFGDVTPKYANEQYATFKVSDFASKYLLTVNGYKGDCGSDSLVFLVNANFTTYDNDNDAYPLNCAQIYSGAWWYSTCHHSSNLNGLYLEGPTVTFANGMTWNECWGQYYSVKTSVMKTKRKV